MNNSTFDYNKWLKGLPQKKKVNLKASALLDSKELTQVMKDELAKRRMTPQEFATILGIKDTSHIYRVLAHKQKVTATILKYFGYKKVTFYEKIQND